MVGERDRKRDRHTDIQRDAQREGADVKRMGYVKKGRYLVDIIKRLHPITHSCDALILHQTLEYLLKMFTLRSPSNREWMSVCLSDTQSFMKLSKIKEEHYDDFLKFADDGRARSRTTSLHKYISTFYYHFSWLVVTCNISMIMNK